jgi:hypothetical protein
MALLTQVEYIEPTYPKVRQDPYEFVRMECGRLIHAAVISRSFLGRLLTNPIKSIEDGFCGEKFAFTREEKQRIKLIQASTLADFSNQLIQAVEHTSSIPVAPEMAFVRWEAHKGLSA